MYTQGWGTPVSPTDLNTIYNELYLGRAVSVMSYLSVSGFSYGDHVVPNHIYTVVGVDLVNKKITLRNPWGNDAGGAADGGWVQGDDDGYVTFTANEFAD